MTAHTRCLRRRSLPVIMPAAGGALRTLPTQQGIWITGKLHRATGNMRRVTKHLSCQDTCQPASTITRLLTPPGSGKPVLWCPPFLAPSVRSVRRYRGV